MAATARPSAETDLSALDAVGQQFGVTTQAPGAEVELPATQTSPMLPGERRSATGNVIMRVPRDKSALDTVASGVAWAESRNRHADDNGKVIMSPKGAAGLMGLMPGTAADLGVDRMDEAQNFAGGRRYLGDMYDKFGNWDDALAAYNAGPGRVEKWIAAGRPDAGKDALPEETKKYVPSVLAHAGFDDTSPTSVVSAKRRGSADDIDDVMTRTRTEAPPVDMNSLPLHEPGAPAADEPSMPSEASALLHGVRRGIQNLAVGAAQATLEQTNPEVARQLTQRVNEFEEQFDAPKQHPILTTIGEAVGTTVGIVAATRLVGPFAAPLLARTVVPQIAGRLGIIGQSAVAGAALGAAQYNPSPEESSRLVESVLGGAFGTLVGTVGKGVMAGARRLADTRAYRDFTNTLREVVGDLSPSSTRLKDNFLERYEQLWSEKNERYTIRNLAGDEIQPGLPREEVGNPVREAMEASRKAGVAPTPTTRSVAAQVDREFGGPEARAEQAAHESAIADFERDKDAWAKSAKSITSIGNPEVRTQALRKAIDEGHIAEPPVHPGEFEAPPITSEQFSSGLQVINRAWVKAKNDPTTRTQLRQMSGAVMNAAKNAAEEAGMEVGEFLRAGTSANKFFRENIGPIYKYFGSKTPADIRGNPNVPFSGVSPAQFFDRAVKILEGHDMEAVRSFAKMVGPAAKDNLIKIAAYQMMQKIDAATIRGGRAAVQEAEKGGKSPAAAMRDYIQTHTEALHELVGREGVEQLRGYAGIADRLAREPEKHRAIFHALTSHRWMQALGVAEMAQGVVSGSGHRIGWGAAMVGIPWANHLLYSVVQNIAKMPGLLPLVRRAGRTKPDSADMDKVMTEIQRRVVATAGITGRVVAPAGNLAAPLVP